MFIIQNGKELNFTKPFVKRTEAIKFAKSMGLGLKNVKSRPAGYVVEK